MFSRKQRPAAPALAEGGPKGPRSAASNATSQDKLRSKSNVGEADAPLEQEADALADAVLQARAPEATDGGPLMGLDDAFAAVLGQPLPQVQVQRGTGAEEQAAGVGAAAFTRGRTVKMGAEEEPYILAHELAHVALGHAEAGQPIRRHPGAPSAPEASLKRGDTGPKVEALQRCLVHLGFLSVEAMNGGPGAFGPRTESAVRRFQEDNGVDPIGLYGPQTAAALTRALGSHATPKAEGADTAVKGQTLSVPTPLLREGNEGEGVEMLQRCLVRLGYMTQAAMQSGPGSFGPRTKAALITFQAAKSLKSRGVYNFRTAAALGAALGLPAPAGKDADEDTTTEGGEDTAATGDLSTEAAWRDFVMSEANSHQGAPYYWGADGPKMFDCSGFVLYVLRNDTGLISWGDMAASGIAGRLPKTKNPKKGDAVFFRGGSGVSHVGLVTGSGSAYLGANGGGSNTLGKDPNARVKNADWNKDGRTVSFGSISNLIDAKL